MLPILPGTRMARVLAVRRISQAVGVVCAPLVRLLSLVLLLALGQLGGSQI